MRTDQGEEQASGEAGDEGTRRRLAYTIGSSDEADEDNRGEILQTLATIMIAVLCVPILIWCVLMVYWGRKLHKSIQKAFTKLKNAFIWNAPLRYWIESYISICLAYVSWYSLPRKWEKGVDYSINIFCLSHLFVYMLSPYLFQRFLNRNFERFKERSFRRKFHEVIIKLNYREKSSTNFFLVFCYRRLLLTVFIVFLTKTPALQIAFQLYVIIGVFIVMGMSNVYRWRFDRVLEYFNEVCILLCCYVYFLFTDFVPDPLLRKDIGNYLLFFTALNVVINLALILKMTISGTHRQYKINRNKKAYMKELQEQERIRNAKRLDKL